MATAFNPQYVNLDRYEAAQIARRANQLSPLDAALQGLDQGIRLQQLPQTLQDQALQRQLNNAMLQEKLNNLQNPDAEWNRRLQKELIYQGALDRTKGIYQTPANLIGETIYNPGAITEQQQAALPSPELLAMRQTALDQAGVPLPEVAIPTAQGGLPESPIVGLGGKQLGLTSNPNAPIQAAQNKLERDIQLANARARTSGIQGQFIPDGFGGMIFAQRPTAPGGEVVSTRVQTPEGKDVVVPTKPPPGTVNRPMTANERVDRANKAGEQGLTEEEAAALLTTPEAQAAYKTGQKKRGEVARIVGVKDLAKSAAKTLEGVDKFQPTFDILKDRFDSLTSQGLVGLIPGNWASFKNYVSGASAHPDLKAYQDELEAFTGQLKAFTNDPGVMTDQDQKRITKALGDITKDPRVAAEKFKDIQEIIDRNGTRAADFLEGRLSLEDIATEFRTRASSRAKESEEKIIIVAPDGIVGNWPSSKPIPDGFKKQ